MSPDTTSAFTTVVIPFTTVVIPFTTVVIADRVLHGGRGAAWRPSDGPPAGRAIPPALRARRAARPCRLRAGGL